MVLQEVQGAGARCPRDEKETAPVLRAGCAHAPPLGAGAAGRAQVGAALLWEEERVTDRRVREAVTELL